MQPPKKCTAIKSLLLLALMWTGALAYAGQAAGIVTHLSGPLLVSKADGSNRVLGPNGAVEPGDTLVTQKKGYAQIKFNDDSQLILMPDTILTIDQFSYDAAKPEADKAAFTLTQGGVRSTAGLMGKRSKDAVTLTTPGGTVNLQGANAVVQYHGKNAVARAERLAWLLASTAALDDSLMTTRSDARTTTAIRPLMLAQVDVSIMTQPGMPPPPPTPTAPLTPGGLAPGLYVQVLDGAINVSNGGGSTNFSAGQFGFTPSIQQPPVLVPANPILQFTPPPAFSAPPGAGSTASKSNTVDCEVR